MGAATSTENAQQSESAPSYWSIMRQGYDELVNAIIRPPRADYDPARLGPTEFEFCGRSYRREDLVLKNARGLALQCSHWAPVGSRGEPCVVFLHGNSSARLEGLNQLSVCLGFGRTLFAFDGAAGDIGNSKLDGQEKYHGGLDLQPTDVEWATEQLLAVAAAPSRPLPLEVLVHWRSSSR